MKGTFRDKMTDWFLSLGKIISQKILYSRYEIEMDMLDHAVLENGPFFMIGNHSTNYDPFLTSIAIWPKKSRYITSAIQNFYLGQKIGMFLVHSIKKQKGRADLITLRKAKRYLDRGYNVFVYPEGNRNFYGETGHIYPSIAKMLKKFQYPVINVLIHGGALLTPRWADYNRRGYLKLEFEYLFTKEQLQEYSEEAIFHKIQKAIQYNDYEWNKIHHKKYWGNNKAHGIESYLYMCPKCKELFTVYGKNDDIYCTQCGHLGTINEYELLDQSDYESINDMGHIQRSNIGDILNQSFEFKRAVLWKLDYVSFRKKKCGNFHFTYENRTIILDSKDNKIVFSIDKMNATTVEFTKRLAFDYEGIDYLLETDQTLILYDMINKYGIEEEVVL